jgi:hypothetical protein
MVCASGNFKYYIPDVGDTTLTMQIKDLVLYNSKGDKRIVPFKLGGVNIITGRSKTGKSAIIEIVEFCLGRSDFRVPEGIIRKNVSWYGLRLQMKESQIFIAKKPPNGNGSSQSQLYLEVGGTVEIPEMAKLVPNSNDDALVEYLSRAIGISPNLNVPPEGQSRDPLEANFKHARFFLFQKQSVIANESILFHRQTEPFIPQTIKDTLPYFLGAIREDQLKTEHELRLQKRELKLLKRSLKEAELLGGIGLSQCKALLEEAKQVGLFHGEVTSEDETVETLRSLLSWKPAAIPIVESDKFTQLQDEYYSLNDEFRVKSDQIKAAESYAFEAVGYSNEAEQQRLRLETIGLFNELENKQSACPFCDSKIETPVPLIQEMHNSLIGLNNSLQTVSRERPKLREYIETLQNERESLRQSLEDKAIAIDAIISEQEMANSMRDMNSRIAKVIGRISLYVENYARVDDDSGLRTKISTIEQRVNELESILDEKITEELLSSILNRIGQQMTNWAKYLELEHSDSPYRLDLKNLRVVADQEERPIPMERMGSGENWLGCHLISHLALHSYFIKKGRPVPSFLILDQPTQVYFPPEKYSHMEGKMDEINDEDRIAVNRMFSLLFEVCESIAPHLQIIVMDHANLDVPQFQSALVEKPWRNGNALIPTDWTEWNPEE